MNTLSDIVAFNREHASPHIAKSDRGWWVAGVVLVALFMLLTVGAWVRSATVDRSSARTGTVVQGTY